MRIAAATAVIAAASVLVAVSTTAATSAPVARPAAAARTTVTLVVTGCDGCTIGVQRAIDANSTVTPHRPTYWNGRKTKVSAGRATFSVPTAYTAGMSFTISAPWQGGAGFVANIVLGDSSAGGKQVTPGQAQHRKLATACWAGTASATATIHVLVTRVMVEGYTKPEPTPLAWASPTVPTVGPLGETVSGTLGNQEAYYC